MSENNDKKSNIDQIIEFYINYQGNKGDAIKELAKKCELSPQRIYQILKENKCPTPREFEKQDKPEKLELLKESEVEVKENTEISIADKLRAYGFKDKAEIERRVNLVLYIKKITGIDVCEEFEDYLVSLVENIESNRLYNDIQAIKKGENIFRDHLSERIQELANKEFEEFIKKEFPDREEQEKKEQLIKEQEKEQDLLTIGFKLCLIDPKLYRNYCISKGYGDPFRELAEAIARSQKAKNVSNQQNDTEKGKE